MFGRIFELSHFDLDVWYSSSSSHNIGQVRRSRSLEVYGYGKCCRRDPEYFNFAVLFAFFSVIIQWLHGWQRRYNRRLFIGATAKQFVGCESIMEDRRED